MADELIPKRQLGDITFGMPKDITLLNKPWGFYEFLELPRDASREDIKKAYRRKSLQFHPDRPGGDPEQFKAVDRVFNILYDDGGELGSEHSQRAQYDKVSILDELFDGFIEHDGERTQKLSEIILREMEAERKYAQAEHDIAQKSPRFAELKQKLERARSDASKEKIAKELEEVVAEAHGLDEKTQQEIHNIMEQRKQEHMAKQEAFRYDFARNPQKYFSKVLDVLYGGGTITFGANKSAFQICMGHHEVKDNILFLLLAGPNYLLGWQRVHFKAQEANVKITDPNLTGIFHVVKGNVVVDYEGSSYGEVIRARAPAVNMIQGFEQRGDLYVPTRFATQNWWRKKPALDIAVHEGAINLTLRQQAFAHSLDLYSLMNSSGTNSSGLEKYFDEYSNKKIINNLNNIIKKDKYKGW